MRKILFLDIDGVLNSDHWWKSSYYKELYKLLAKEYKDNSGFDPVLVEKLNTIVKETQCEIVISSAWRLTYSVVGITNLLKFAGFQYTDKVIDQTPSLAYKNYGAQNKYNEIFAGYTGRGSEIKDWLDRNPDVTSFVILDDNTDMSPVKDHLVKTSPRYGLSDIDCAKAILMLNKTNDGK